MLILKQVVLNLKICVLPIAQSEVGLWKALIRRLDIIIS